MALEFDNSGGAGDREEKPSPVKIDYDLCEATGVCESVCPEDVLLHREGFTQVVKGQACTECWICVENCRSAALEIG